MKSRKIARKLEVTMLAFATMIGSIGVIPTLAATNSQSLGIKGTVTAISTLDITVPVQPLEFTIDNEGAFCTEAKTISNNTAVPVYAYVTEVYGASGDYPEIVDSTTYDDWSVLSHEQTIAQIALQLNGNELSKVYQPNNSTKSAEENYIALGGIEAASGVKNIELIGNNGKAWNNAEDVVFTYTANMLFTSIEGNFGTGSGGASGSFISSSYSSNAATAQSEGKTPLIYEDDFTISTTGSPTGLEIECMSWNKSESGMSIQLNTKYKNSVEYTSYTVKGAGESSYSMEYPISGTNTSTTMGMSIQIANNEITECTNGIDIVFTSSEGTVTVKISADTVSEMIAALQ